MKTSDAGLPQPGRVQRKRTKGWRMTPNTVYVGRPTWWGNLARVGGRIIWNDREWSTKTPEDCVAFYREWIVWQATPDELRRELGGKNLACWCPLDQPCHADVLLELANKEDSE